MPDGSPQKPGYLNNIGGSLRIRLGLQPDDATLAQAISIYSESAKLAYGLPFLRFVAACEWADLCFSTGSRATLDAYSTLVDLLPRLVWLGRSVEQKYKDIPSISTAMANAVAAAIHFGELSLALEWMEQSRSIVWGQMLQLRTPLDELREHHSDDAKELERIARALDSGGVPDHSETPSDGASQLEQEGRARHRLAEDYERTLARIRGLPRFTEFLRPARSTFLCSVATSGPVVIVNAHNSRCDALIILPSSTQVHHVPLRGLQLSAVQEMQVQLAGLTRGADTIPRHYAPHSEVGTGLPDVLERLWLHLVEPILNHLKVRTSILPPFGRY